MHKEFSYQLLSFPVNFVEIRYKVLLNHVFTFSNPVIPENNICTENLFYEN